MELKTNLVSSVVFSKRNGEIMMLMLKRIDDNYWCNVAGKIELGESATAAVIREIAEETQLKVDKLYSADYIQQFYHAQTDQIFMAIGFVAFCAGEQPVIINHEHTEYRWCSLEQALMLAPFPNQHQFYKHVWEHYIDAQPSSWLRVSE